MSFFSSPRPRRAIVLAGKTHYEIIFTEPRDPDKTRVVAALRKPRASASVFEEASGAGVPFSEILVLLSRDQVTVRLLDLPTTDPEEIRDIVSIQAAKQTPLSRDQIVWDYRVTGSTGDGYSKVFLGVAQREKVEALCGGAEAKPKVLASLGLDSERVAGWAQAYASREGAEAYGALDWTVDGVDFSVVARGEVVFTRVLQLEAGPEARPDWEGRLLEEMRFIMTSYQDEHAGPAFDRVVVHAPTEAFEAIRDVLEGGLSMHAVYASPAPPGVELSAAAAKELKSLIASGITFAKVLGAASPSFAAKTLDFTPQAVKKRTEAFRRRHQLVLTAVLAGLVALSAVAVALEKSFSSLLRLNALDKMERSLLDRVGPLAETDRRVQLARERLAQAASFNALLGGVGAGTPAGVYLVEMNYEDEVLSLRGTASGMPGIYQYTRNLEGIGHFKVVKTRYVNKRQVEGGEVLDFEIICSASRRSAASFRL